jgi:sugar lactone lactonase YvrE
MNPIQTNKPIFFGNDGEVLKSGRIYIGQPNQYPISFPKTVTFQD